MDRACIHQLNELVKSDEAFSNSWGKQNKWPSMQHIMVLLKYLGSYGNEASFQKIGWAMWISKGTMNDCVMRASSAILKLRRMFLNGWMKSKGNKSVQGLNKHMVLSKIVLDWWWDIVFPLAFAPTLNMEDYFMRKGNYAIKGLFIGYYTAKITWIEIWWPGSIPRQSGMVKQWCLLVKGKVFQQQCVSAWWFGIFCILCYGSCFQKGP